MGRFAMRSYQLTDYACTNRFLYPEVFFFSEIKVKFVYAKNKSLINLKF